MHVKCFMIVMLSTLWIPTWSGNTERVDGVTETTTNSYSKKYCGTYLTDALATLCDGIYAAPRQGRIHKKSYWSSRFRREISGNPLPSEFPFQPKQQVTSMLEKFGGRRRRRRGVYNECCQKSCSHEELMQYCAAPSTTTDLPTTKTR